MLFIAYAAQSFVEVYTQEIQHIKRVQAMYLEEELNQCINGRSVEESKQLEKNLECVQKMVP